MTAPTPNLIPRDVTLRQLVSLIDAHTAELVNPADLYPHLIEAVGKFRAWRLMTAAAVIIMVRDDSLIAETSPRELLSTVASVLCLLASFLASGSWRPGLLGMCAAFGLVALCHAVARNYRNGGL
ncbi:MAG TPA: hypothetical protein DGG94_10300 [Micromonosporaceae bacterium]|nr:hypothetical protein [Micromonosporaceae bacterium]HCU50173.1 hypothetical protein [Micromonosporaceae bacterium]